MCAKKEIADNNTGTPRANATGNTVLFQPCCADRVEIACGNPPAHCHPKIKHLFNHWQSIHPASGLPGRQHLDPSGISGLLPDICLIDIVPPPADFVFRLVGTRLDYFYGASFTGKPLLNAYQKSRQSRTYLDLCAMLHDYQPRWRIGPAHLVKNREHIIAERLFLPLAEDGVTVDMILGILFATIGKESLA